MEPLISVIVPVYNVEKYITTCIMSILNQTYSNIEVILVDDGSTDESPNLCDMLLEHDIRISVIHKENGGVSSARNRGLEMATGDYICFIDSDDSIPIDGIEKLVEALIDGKHQFVAGICKIKKYNKVKNKISSYASIVFDEKPEMVLKYVTSEGSYSPYAKLYKSSIIKYNKLRFREDMKIGEDAVFVREYLKCCDAMCLIPSIVYEYHTDNEASLSHKRYDDYCIFYNKKMKVLNELIMRLNLSENKKNEFMFYRAIHGINISFDHYFSHWLGEKERKCFMELTIKTLSPWMKDRYVIQDVALNKWYRKYSEDINEININKLFYRYNRKMIKKRYISKIVKILREKYRYFRMLYMKMEKGIDF